MRVIFKQLPICNSVMSWLTELPARPRCCLIGSGMKGWIAGNHNHKNVGLKQQGGVCVSFLHAHFVALSSTFTKVRTWRAGTKYWEQDAEGAQPNKQRGHQRSSVPSVSLIVFWSSRYYIHQKRNMHLETDWGSRRFALSPVCWIFNRGMSLQLNESFCLKEREGDGDVIYIQP